MLTQLQHFYLVGEDETIPYSRRLREFTRNIAATILMHRLEYHFKKHPDGFHKFLTTSSKTSEHQLAYSWQEELGFSKEEFTRAFSYIGARHITKEHYQRAMQPFFDNKNNEKYYCSYSDRSTGQTWYFRNHFLVDALGEKLSVYKD
jgi:hypothetical protein